MFILLGMQTINIMRHLLPDIIWVYIHHTLTGHGKYYCKSSMPIYVDTFGDLLEYVTKMI